MEGFRTAQTFDRKVDLKPCVDGLNDAVLLSLWPTSGLWGSSGSTGGFVRDVSPCSQRWTYKRISTSAVPEVGKVGIQNARYVRTLPEMPGMEVGGNVSKPLLSWQPPREIQTCMCFACGPIRNRYLADSGKCDSPRRATFERVATVSMQEEGPMLVSLEDPMFKDVAVAGRRDSSGRILGSRL